MAQKILLVDDESNIRDLNALYLEKEGYAVEHATNGTEALARFAQSPPAMVVLDVMMPGMDGFEVCRRLRADPKTARVPIVMFTALDTADRRERAMAIGATAFWVKPFMPNDFLPELERLVQEA